MKLPKLNKLKEYSFLVIPIYHGIETRNYKLSIKELVLYLFIYTVIGAFFYYFIFSFTPAKYLLPFDVGEAYTNRKAEIIELNKKVIFLSKELENISSLNKKLKIAIRLGDSNLIDSIKTVKKNIEKKENPYGGNILAVIQKLFFTDTTDSIGPSIFFIKPVPNGFVNKQFNNINGHFGIDFLVKSGTPVIASAGGYIVFSDYTSSDGYMIIIQHNDNYTTVYKHCSELLKKVRDKVIQGETIALSGNSGYNTTGPHLHFEIWKDGQTINPINILIN
jgi:murein DD-endopeptidase MepM/ murein hydrolase activator NlpD